MGKSYGKLVRDGIPDIIKKNGEEPLIKILDDPEYKQLLDVKLMEEIKEYIESEELDELADTLEVINAIGALNDYLLEEILSKAITFNEQKEHEILKQRLLMKASSYLEDPNIFNLVPIAKIIKEIAYNKGSSIQNIIDIMNDKRSKRGGFTKKIYLIGVK